ncbi:general substrate transporter [Artomyces pyxidatus]|uniref:General substrate transporter n=1 Tax=Artomyces pyxidatus TaxID=48021 RepID=A0ACB8SL02_9AGAM|nr:general substrate transporter [Artomyces pyxidatus]
MATNPPSFTVFGWLVCTWVVVVSFQYGYHISTLNQIQAVLTCRETNGPAIFYGLPTCIPMTDATFSVLTSVYTVGGLLGSLTANLFMDNYGRKAAIQFSTGFVAVGAGLMSLSGSMTPLLFGRLLTGVGAGIGLCVGPIFLNEIAPVKIRGSVGVLIQLATVTGILVAQLLGVWLATPSRWRCVLIFSSVLSAVHLLLGVFMVETPVYLKKHGRLEALLASEQRLWTISNKRVADDAEDPLLDTGDDDDNKLLAPDPALVSLTQLLHKRELRRPLIIVSSAMVSAQISGINAVLYYSNDILSRSLPELGPYVSLGITVVNALMTFPPIFLIERLGRKPLLFGSILGAIASLIFVGVGLNSGLVLLSSVAIMTFVMSFAVGLGPIPFVIIPEVSPAHAVSSLSSFGLSLNWIVNFFVGLVFLPLRNILSGGDSSREGRVFYVFACLLFVSGAVLFRSYR